VSPSARCAAAVLGVVVFTPLLAFMALGNPPPPVPASDTAQADIPPGMLAVYQEAAAACGLSWQVLAALGKVASDHGRATPAPLPGGPVGPMGLLPADTTAAGNDPADPAGAVRATAAFLCSQGATDPARLPAALADLNPDLDVARVLAVTDSYRSAVPAGLAPLAP